MSDLREHLMLSQMGISLEDQVQMDSRRGSERMASGQDWLEMPRHMNSCDFRGVDMLAALADFEELGFKFHPDDRELFVTYAWAFAIANAEYRANEAAAGGRYNTDLWEIWQDTKDELEKAYRQEARDFNYVRIQLPEGWTSHRDAMTYYVDTEGYERVSSYYNGQFWDPFYSAVILRLQQTVAQHKTINKLITDGTLGNDWRYVQTPEGHYEVLNEDRSITRRYSRTPDATGKLIKQFRVVTIFPDGRVEDSIEDESLETTD